MTCPCGNSLEGSHGWFCLQCKFGYYSDLQVLNWYNDSQQPDALAEIKRRGLTRWLEDDGTVEGVLELCGVPR